MPRRQVALMARRACDGAGLLGAFRAAAAGLEAAVDEVNALNVFPVPDGDTGSNMMATVRAALAEAEALGPDRVRGAGRGRGGVRGADGRPRQLRRDHEPDPARPRRGPRRQDEVQRARPRERARPGHEGGLRRGREAGRGHDPDRHPRGVGGRGRERRARADARGGHGRDRRGGAEGRREDAVAARDPARGGRRRLRRAGPVPAVRGRARVPDRRRRRSPAPRLPGRAAVAAAAGGPRRRAQAQHGAPPGAGMRDEGFGYETMFLAQAAPGKPLDVDGDPDLLESIGESVLVAGDARAIKVHIHNERPDQVLAYALGLGHAVEDQRREPRPAGRATSARRARRRSRATAAGDGAGARGSRTPATARPAARSRAPTRSALAVVAVAAGEGLAAIFRDFGVAPGRLRRPDREPEHRRAARGGQVASTPARSCCCRTTRTSSSPRARSSAMTDRPVAVVATRNAAEGFAALLALDPDKSARRQRRRDDRRGPRRSSRCRSPRRSATRRSAARRSSRARRSRSTPTTGSSRSTTTRDGGPRRRSRRSSPGFELITLYYGDGGDLAGDRGARAADPRPRHRARRSRSSTAASRTTAT